MLPATRTASQNGTQTKEQSFAAVVSAIEGILVLKMQYDPAKTAIVPYQLYNLTHFFDTGVKFGFNSQFYVTHRAVYRATGGSIKVKAMPIPAPVGGAAASGDFMTITGTVTTAGNVVFYFHGEKFSLGAALGLTADEVGDLVQAALAGSSDVLVDTVVNTSGVLSGNVTYLGSTGDEVRVTGPKETDDQTPEGLTIAYGAFTSGAGDETPLQAAWDAFILDPVWKTDVVGPTATTSAMDLATLNIGLPEDGTSKGSGLWKDSDYRPCTNWLATIADQSTSEALGANRELDPNNIIAAAPDRREMPYVIAAVEAARCIEKWNGNSAAAPKDLRLVVIDGPEAAANDWTAGANGDNNVQSALDAGLATVKTDENGNSIMGDVATTYRPVQFAYPAFQFEVNKRKTWNMGKSLKEDKVINGEAVFTESKAEAVNQPLAVDVTTYQGRVVALAILWVKEGWAYNSTFTITNMQIEVGAQGNPDRVDRYIPVILTGNARVQSDTVLVDRNLEAAGLSGVALNVG